MKTDRTSALIVVLLVATLGMQGYQLYSNRRAAPPPPIQDAKRGTVVDIAGHPTHGNPAAKVALVEFSDFECPFCARFAKETSPEIDKEFGATLLRVFVNNPLPIHPSARKLAELGLCQAEFWSTYHQLFAKGEGLTCAGSDFSSQVDRDIELAKKIGLTSTPNFVLGTVENGRVIAKTIIRGAVPASDFISQIQKLR